MRAKARARNAERWRPAVPRKQPTRSYCTTQCTAASFCDQVTHQDVDRIYTELQVVADSLTRVTLLQDTSVV